MSFDVEQKYTKRPWYVILMAVWAFWGIGSFALSLVRFFFKGNQQTYQLVAAILLCLVIVMIVNIVKMKKPAIIIFGILNVLLAIWQSLNLLKLFSFGTPKTGIVVYLLYLAVPSLIMAYLSLRPSFLYYCVKFSESKDFQSIQKIASKK